MATVKQADESLEALTKILGQFKAPVIFDTEFSKLLESINLSREDIKDDVTESDIFNTIEGIFDTKLGAKNWIVDGVLNTSNIALKTSTGKGLPQFTASINSNVSLASVPTDIVFNIGLDAGSFVGDFTQPIFSKIDKVIQPLEYINRVLTTNLPGLDAIGIDINILSYASIYKPNETKALKDFFLLLKLSQILLKK